VARTDIVDFTTGVNYADALLRIATDTPWIVTVRHRAGLGWPGQTVHLSFAERVISGDFMIQSVECETDVDDVLVSTFECLGGTELQSQWVDYFKTLAGGSASGTSSISGSITTTTTVLSSPVDLGGARGRPSEGAAGWFDIPEYAPYFAQASFTGRLRCDLWVAVAGATVQARLYDVTAAAAVGTTTSETATSAQPHTATCTITAGHEYRVQLNRPLNQPVYCGYAKLEST
jgi:hypothetical protein